MKTMRKMLALLLAVVFILTLTACGTKEATPAATNPPSRTPSSDETPADSPEPQSEPVKFTTFKGVYGPATFTTDSAYLEYIRENANVDLDVQIVPIGEMYAKTHTFAASGSFPDLMTCDGPMDTFWREIENQGAFAPLDEYLEKYPELKAITSDSVWEWLRNPEDGHIYFIPCTANANATFFLMYRKDVFDDLGIPEPTTIEELEKALETVQREMPDMVPWSMAENHPSLLAWLHKDLATSFGATAGWNVDADNNLVPDHMDKGMVDFMFWLQDMRDRGLFDADCGVSSEYTMGAEKWKTGRVAVLTANSQSYFSYYKDLLANDPDAEVGILSGLVGPTGIKGGLRPISPISGGYYVSSQCDNVDAMMEFLNWQVDEGYEFCQYGLEGKSYTIGEDGNRISIPEDEREEAYKEYQREPLVFMGPLKAVAGWGNVESGWKASGMDREYYDYFIGKLEDIASNKYYEMKYPTVVSPTSVEIGAQLFESYLSNYWSAGIVLNPDVTREEYETVVKDWLDAGGQTIVDEVNALQTDRSVPDYGQ